MYYEHKNKKGHMQYNILINMHKCYKRTYNYSTIILKSKIYAFYNFLWMIKTSIKPEQCESCSINPPTEKNSQQSLYNLYSKNENISYIIGSKYEKNNKLESEKIHN